ncbi:hypothetical protein HDU91_000421 [Kappamyces sp. JEL0680]|nr:hypothetical protein HDU91_000421 [Kappamyces sp. JEL0680]
MPSVSLEQQWLQLVPATATARSAQSLLANDYANNIKLQIHELQQWVHGLASLLHIRLPHAPSDRARQAGNPSGQAGKTSGLLPMESPTPLLSLPPLWETADWIRNHPRLEATQVFSLFLLKWRLVEAQVRSLGPANTAEADPKSSILNQDCSRAASQRTLHLSVAHQFLMDRLARCKLDMDSLLESLQRNRKLLVSTHDRPSADDTPASIAQGAWNDESEESEDDGLDEATRLMFEKENQDLLAQFEGTMDLVRDATQALAQVGEMQSTLAMHLDAQQNVVETIFNDAVVANENIDQGLKQLKEAEKHFGGPKYWVLAFFVGLSLSLLFLDLVLS